MTVHQKTILLVEDDAIIALSQKMQLEKYGYRLIHAISGEAALEIFIKSNPTIDLVLMDIDLGAGMDGTQAAREILKIRTVPVVFLSSHTEPDIVEKTESITSYGYVVKNSSITVLDASIKMAFKLFDAHRDILKHKVDSETANKQLHSAITKLEKTNKTLTRLNSAVENTKEVIFITDTTGLITYINPQFTKVYGYTKEEVVGKLNPRFLLAETVSDEINDEFWNNIMKEPHLRIQFLNKTKEGKHLTVETSIDPIYDSRGEIKEFVQIQRDISEELQAEETIIKGNDYLSFLNTIALEQAGTSSLEDLSKLIIEQLKKITNAIFVSFTEYDRKDKLLKNMKLSASQPVLNAGIKVVGGKILNTEVPVNEEFFQTIINKRIKTFPSLYENTNGSINKRTSDILSRALKIDKVWGLSYVIKGELFGTSAFALKKGQEAPDRKVLESFLNVSSISIKRLLLENELKQQVEELRNANARQSLLSSDANQMKSILDNYEEAIWAVDKDFNFTFMNKYFMEDYRKAYGIQILPGSNNFEIMEDNVLKIWKPKYEAALKGEKISFEFEEDAKRGKKYFRVNLNPIHTEGKISGVSAISVDITKQKLAELKAQEEILKSQQYLDIAGVMFVAINKRGLITLVNKKTCEISGYTEAELIGQDWFELMIPKQQKSDVVSVFRQLLSGEIEPVEYYENPILTKDGEERIIAWHNTILKDEDGNITGYLSSGSDVTEKRMLENRTLNSELLFKTLANFTNDWEYWTAPDGREKYVSPSVEKITGYSPEEFLCTPGFYMKLIYAKDIALLKKHTHSKNAAGELEPIDFRIIRKNGDVRWISHTCRKIYDEEGNYLGIRGSNRDITERKNAELRIKELLNRNELILKEVHHRIKNHMTTLISLVSLQAGRVKSKEAVDALGETENRIRGMMVLYDKLYRSADFEYTSVRPYLSGLIDSIFENINNKVDIKIKKVLSDFKVNAGTIFNIGIIINELITNSIKYAFTDRLSGLITIDISPTDDGFILVVKDNGTGLPADFSLEDNNGFGMELIKMIVLQMNGNFSMEGSNGTKAIISGSFKK